jgi:hypothetical protein
MSRRPAKFTQSDVARALRAAQQVGAARVEVKPDGSLLIHLMPVSTKSADQPVEADREIVL